MDYNHAPPGQPAYPGVRVEGSYLHLLAGLQVAEGAYRPDTAEAGGANHFVTGGHPTDWTGAKVTLRLRGELEARGARLGLLVQTRVASVDKMVNSVLGFPGPVTGEWAEQSITLTTDDDAWQCLGSRHDRFETYGSAPISEVLADMNGAPLPSPCPPYPSCSPRLRPSRCCSRTPLACSGLLTMLPWSRLDSHRPGPSPCRPRHHPSPQQAR